MTFDFLTAFSMRPFRIVGVGGILGVSLGGMGACVYLLARVFLAMPANNHLLATLILLIFAGLSLLRGMAITLGTGVATPILTVAELVLDILGKPRSLLTFSNDRPGQVVCHCASAEKAKRLLGWQPATKLAWRNSPSTPFTPMAIPFSLRCWRCASRWDTKSPRCPSHLSTVDLGAASCRAWRFTRAW